MSVSFVSLVFVSFFISSLLHYDKTSSVDVGIYSVHVQHVHVHVRLSASGMHVNVLYIVYMYLCT